MKRPLVKILVPITLAAAVVVPWSIRDKTSDNPAIPTENPVLTVVAISAQPTSMALKVAANGNILAWQEASISTEANGLRLKEVKADIGDRVKRGQILAIFAAETLEAELAQSRAALAEALVALVEATANAQRARTLKNSGALSEQQIQQYLNAEHTAQARREAAEAIEKTQRLRLAQTRVVAPDDGVISARTATIGAVVPAGQELFRLIRQERLEWRAEVAASDLMRLEPGLTAWITTSNNAPIKGRLRILAPVVDTQTRNGMVYVDLPPGSNALAGMFARGEFELGQSEALTLPQSAVLLRDGFSHVLRINTDSRVVLTRVETGRRDGDRVEIRSGIDLTTQVVASGGIFLSDGDLVRVVAPFESDHGQTPPGDTP